MSIIYSAADAAIDIARAHAQMESDENRLPWFVPASADLHSGSLRAGGQ